MLNRMLRAEPWQWSPSFRSLPMGELSVSRLATRPTILCESQGRPRRVEVISPPPCFRARLLTRPSGAASWLSSCRPCASSRALVSSSAESNS